MSLEIRELGPEDWRLFRDFRLEALRAAPGVFSTSFDEARARADATWAATLSDPDNAVFGVFDVDRMIALTSVFTSRDDPERRTALLAMSFIDPAYRGRGLSGMLYDARLDWVRRRPGFRRVVVSHRRSNTASMRANQRYGFRLIDESPRVWPDGETEDELIYELLIPPRG